MWYEFYQESKKTKTVLSHDTKLTSRQGAGGTIILYAGDLVFYALARTFISHHVLNDVDV